MGKETNLKKINIFCCFFSFGHFFLKINPDFILLFPKEYAFGFFLQENKSKFIVEKKFKSKIGLLSVMTIWVFFQYEKSN